MYYTNYYVSQSQMAIQCSPYTALSHVQNFLSFLFPQYNYIVIFMNEYFSCSKRSQNTHHLLIFYQCSSRTRYHFSSLISSQSSFSLFYVLICTPPLSASTTSNPALRPNEVPYANVINLLDQSLPKSHTCDTSICDQPSTQLQHTTQIRALQTPNAQEYQCSPSAVPSQFILFSSRLLKELERALSPPSDGYALFLRFQREVPCVPISIMPKVAVPKFRCASLACEKILTTSPRNSNYFYEPLLPL